MIAFLLITMVSSAKYEDKEETCLTLASRSVKERETEISEHIRNYPDLTEKEFSSKIVEDSYNYCMKTITIKEITSLGGIAQRPFRTYSHLVRAPLDGYTSIDQLQVSKHFSEYRIEISKRIAMNSMRGPNL